MRLRLIPLINSDCGHIELKIEKREKRRQYRGVIKTQQIFCLDWNNRHNSADRRYFSSLWAGSARVTVDFNSPEFFRHASILDVQKFSLGDLILKLNQLIEPDLDNAKQLKGAIHSHLKLLPMFCLLQ